MEDRVREKKIAVVSCYFHHNYGSVLQAYATQAALDKLGYPNETIDISGFRRELSRAKRSYFIRAALHSDILEAKLGMAKSALRRKLGIGSYAKGLRLRAEKTAAFREKQFRLSGRYASKAELGRVCAERYGAVLVGSDQLWTPANIAADYYTLNFVPEGVNTIAYGTSFGQEALPADSAGQARLFLGRIRQIGVREESGKRMIKELTGRSVPVVCDPTMLLTGEEWNKIQREEPVAKGDYILCYFLGTNRRHREFAKKLRAETGCRIVALPHLDEYVECDKGYADELLFAVGPEDFLNLIRNAAYICTDSYHGTVFSALYRRPFFVLRRYAADSKQSTNGRLDTLLGMMGLTERLVASERDIEVLLGTEIDYDAVHKKIAAAREKSYAYLRAAVAL